MTTTSALAPQTSLSHPPSATNVVYSIIIPTYKEAKNLPTVIPNIYAALQQSPFLNQTEVVVVDDNSQDGTIQVCDELIKRFGVPGGFTIRLITRTTDRGLSSAVLRGFSDSHGSYLLCMDADGQHPAHVLPRLFTALHTSEFVIGTRKGGKVDSSWGLGRTIISKGAGALVIPLTSMSDPMT
ncbi:nucleotide-diphospho-sugar transferase, partial [Fimicolochytrium jonesii]|uniref:nucleotide-diphospho-sugar transferase n=1 Tax=Fimicolochytrium jonesii TaxID=1396493 RepID=UPI0022FDB599